MGGRSFNRNMKLGMVTLVVIVMFLPQFAEAQCAMCRAVLESEDSQVSAKGINDGILYLMAFPYILIAGIAYFIYRSFRKKDSAS